VGRCELRCKSRLSRSLSSGREASSSSEVFVILSGEFASLREANLQSKDLYSSQILLTGGVLATGVAPRRSMNCYGSFDSAGRFAKRIDQHYRMTDQVTNHDDTSAPQLREMFEYSAPAQIADTASSPMPSQKGPISTCPRPKRAR
jgi:hypothetical protein